MINSRLNVFQSVFSWSPENLLQTSMIEKAWNSSWAYILAGLIFTLNLTSLEIWYSLAWPVRGCDRKIPESHSKSLKQVFKVIFATVAQCSKDKNKTDENIFTLSGMWKPYSFSQKCSWKCFLRLWTQNEKDPFHKAWSVFRMELWTTRP